MLFMSGSHTKHRNLSQVAKITGKATLKEEAGLKRNRSASLAAATGAQRVPLGPVRPNNATSTTTTTVAPSTARLQQPAIGSIRQSETAPELSKPTVKAVVVEDVDLEDDDSMDVVEQEVVAEVHQSTRSAKYEAAEQCVEEDENVEDEEPAVHQIWPALTPRAAEKYKCEIDQIQKTFHDELDMFDTTMVHEYADDIFEYMGDLEVCSFPERYKLFR